MQRLLQPERQQGFGWNIYALAPSQNLSSGSCSGANTRADRCSFSASGDGANYCAEHCAAADIFAGALVRSDTFLAFRGDDVILSVNRVTLPVDRNGIHIQRHLVVRDVPDDQFDVRSTWNGNCALPVHHILVDDSGKGLPVVFLDIDCLISSHI